MFKLLSYGEFPVEPTRDRPTDDEIYLTQDDAVWWKIQCKLPPKTKRFCPLVLK